MSYYYNEFAQNDIETEYQEQPQLSSGEHRSITHSFWFWIIVVVIVIFVVLAAFLIIWLIVRNPASSNSGSNTLKTSYSFSTTDNFPIVTFANLDIANNTIQPETPPLNYNNNSISFTSGNTSNFIVFNENGTQGPGVEDGDGSLIITLTPAVQAISMKIVELSGTNATITFTVTGTDGTINTMSTTVPASSTTFMGIVANLPNIKTVMLDRTGSVGTFGISDVQYGSNPAL